MSNKTHTPGPWKMGGRIPTEIEIRSTATYPILICKIDIDTAHPGLAYENCLIAEANANLISAAPDMYAALKAINDGDGSLTESEIVKQMRAAIAKAEGKK